MIKTFQHRRNGWQTLPCAGHHLGERPVGVCLEVECHQFGRHHHSSHRPQSNASMASQNDELTRSPEAYKSMQSPDVTVMVNLLLSLLMSLLALAKVNSATTPCRKPRQEIRKVLFRKTSAVMKSRMIIVIVRGKPHIYASEDYASHYESNEPTSPVGRKADDKHISKLNKRFQ